MVLVVKNAPLTRNVWLGVVWGPMLVVGRVMPIAMETLATVARRLSIPIIAIAERVTMFVPRAIFVLLGDAL